MMQFWKKTSINKCQMSEFCYFVRKLQLFYQTKVKIIFNRIAVILQFISVLYIRSEFSSVLLVLSVSYGIRKYSPKFVKSEMLALLHDIRGEVQFIQKKGINIFIQKDEQRREGNEREFGVEGYSIQVWVTRIMDKSYQIVL
ncbi:unnamed protein product (macronuclear) [Paramecium tetraurelia]|uniref:Uncharacterized protein n=1 Tax=Paramecium tetraurelia TaxID=5888 RepID=A0BZ35_PARTE|nr:uncharacterized protein GSPATT00033655001 [Paramecium tetraurelia]CAK63802.1 unnamed protein product [Paramecium tetraurelia]|eukprot:XP_001431200.1 hypothetical protein (macronuclear) [Paramecium tetraurelia strain d4-2]